MRLPIYLDYAATTPTDPRVAVILSQHLGQDGIFGNPASNTHVFGRAAARAVETARTHVAALLDIDPGAIVWTSGATEANNLALFGVMRAYARKGRHLVTWGGAAIVPAVTAITHQTFAPLRAMR